MRARKQLSNGFYRVAVFERSQCVVCLLLCYSELLFPHHDGEMCKHCVFAQAGQARGQLRASNRFCNRYS